MVETRKQRRARGQMENFVHFLTEIMPLSSLTEKSVRHLYKLVLKKQITDSQSKALRCIVSNLAKMEDNKERRASRSKTRMREKMLKYLHHQREKERNEKELTRIEKELAREKRILAEEKKLLAKLQNVEVQLERHLAVSERIPDHVFFAPEKIKSLTVLAHDRVFDIMGRLEKEFYRTHDQLNAISDEF